ncbi:MAG: hypothetical protein WC617_20230 [Rhodanobacter sp.]|jgi:hypothetical protein
MGGHFKSADSRVDKSRILAPMGMYAVYKGSPIALGKNIYDNIKVGRWKHGDLRKHQFDVDSFLAGTRMSDEEKKAVAKLMLNRASRSDTCAQFSPVDVVLLDAMENDLNIEVGNCVNF